MDLTRSGTVVSPRPPAARPKVSADLVAVLLALFALNLWVTHAVGGREDGALTKGLLALLPAIALSQPWKHVPCRVILLAALPAVGAVFVCAASPLSWAGVSQIALTGYAGLLFLVMASVGRTSRRRGLLLAALAALGGLQALFGLWVWQAGGDVHKLMIGSFYWHNPFAAYVGAGCLLATGVAVRTSRRGSLVAMATASLCLVGVLLSGSRASLAMVSLVWATLLVVLLWRSPRRGPVLVRGAAILVGAALLGALVTSPLVMSGSGNPFATAQARADEGLESSGSTRLGFYRAALDVAAEHPATGTGFGGYLAAATRHQGPYDLRAKNVHNGLLQALAEGGIPYLLAILLPLGALTLAVGRRLRSRSEVVVSATGAAALALLFGHSLVDFDWTFPALPLMFAAVAGLVVAVPIDETKRAMPHRRVALPLVLMLAVIGVTAAVRAQSADAFARSGVVPAGHSWLYGTAGPFEDPRFARAVLTQRETVSAERLTAAVNATTRLAKSDVTLAWLRDTALISLGRTDEGLASARTTWAEVQTNLPLQAIGYARVLDAAGREDEGTRVIIEQAYRTLDAGLVGESRTTLLLSALVRRGGDAAQLAVQCAWPRLSDTASGKRLFVHPGAPSRSCPIPDKNGTS